MKEKLFDSELKIMSVIWKHETVTAKEIAEEMKIQVGWSKATTYTLIKRCISKGAVERLEPNFICRPLISKNEIRDIQATALLDKLYDGIPDQLIASLLGQKKSLTPEKINQLLKMINELENK